MDHSGNIVLADYSSVRVAAEDTRGRSSARHAHRFRPRRSDLAGFLQIRALRQSEAVALSPAETGVLVTSAVTGSGPSSHRTRHGLAPASFGDGSMKYSQRLSGDHLVFDLREDEVRIS